MPERAADDRLAFTAAYHYDFPRELIAQAPAEPRDASRLLHLTANGKISDRSFREFPELLRAGDVLVINETRVIRARLRGTRVPGNGRAEILLLRPADRPHYDPEARRWHALVNPGRQLRSGARVVFGACGFADVIATGDGGLREIELHLDVPFDELLARCGDLPLPPYVGLGDEKRAERYQSVFATTPGSVAAPTASLHFTDEILARIRARGVIVVPLVLEVGLGTFRPMSSERLEQHVMHAESYAIPIETASEVARAKREGRRVIAAGTTVARALEGCAQAHDGRVTAGNGETALFIVPGFEFRIVDALLTNFHLPASTLLVLVCAFAGHDRVLAAYAHATRAAYRFYSFGDATFVERPGTGVK